MSYRAYFAQKISTMVVTILLVATLNFYIIQVLPGDPARTILPRGTSNVSNQTSLIDQLHREWGLDQPVEVRYLVYMFNLVRGDWGTSITFLPGHSVWDVMIPRLLTTLIFVGLGTLISIWLGVRMGVFAGWREGRKADSAATFMSLVTYSVPTFWLGIGLILAFAVYLPLLPTGQEVSVNYPSYDFLGKIEDRIVHLIMPLSVFVINNYAIFTLIMRSSLVEQLASDYNTTAKAKGLSDRLVLRRHAIPNARLPVVTTIALYIGWIFSGAIVIEVVFGLNGIGRLTWDAVQSRDFPLMSAIFLLGTISVVVANTVADLLYPYLDPRVTEA